MIAAATFGYIVVQTRYIEQFNLGQITRDVGRHGKFFCGLGKQKPSNVFNYLQRMGVDRIDMKEIMLHLPDDLPNLRKITPQNAISRHAPKLQGDLVR